MRAHRSSLLEALGEYTSIRDTKTHRVLAGASFAVALVCAPIFLRKGARKSMPSPLAVRCNPTLVRTWDAPAC